LICPAIDSNQALATLIEASSFPMLQVLRHLDPATGAYLGIDYAQGVGLAVDHLCDLGHRDIVFLGEALHHSAAAERRIGFEAGMRRHGLEPRYQPCPLTRSGGAAAVEALCAAPNPPTALVCFNDVVAFGAMTSLAALGKRVGADVSVVGFDNVPEAAFVRPGLTTVDSSARLLGVEAARLILDSLRAGTPLGDRSPTRMPTRLVLRKTTGPV
jgi:LacI family transcriptional regulator